MIGVVVAHVDELVVRCRRARARRDGERAAASSGAVTSIHSSGPIHRNDVSPAVELVSGSNGRPSPSAVAQRLDRGLRIGAQDELSDERPLRDAERAGLARDRRAMGERRAAKWRGSAIRLLPLREKIGRR